MAQNKKTPLRMCTGCGEMKNKRDLVRVVRDKDGNISLDRTGRKAGRGAYVCPDLECLKKARKSRRIDRSFRCQIPEDVYDAMEREMQQNE